MCKYYNLNIQVSRLSFIYISKVIHIIFITYPLDSHSIRFTRFRFYMVFENRNFFQRSLLTLHLYEIIYNKR